MLATIVVIVINPTYIVAKDVSDKTSTTTNEYKKQPAAKYIVK